MRIIYIPYDVPAAIVKKIRAHLKEVALHDVNWGGVDFKIARDDYTWISGDASVKAVALSYKIQDIIFGKEEL